MFQRIGTIVGIALVAGLGWLGYAVLKSQMTAEVYRDRLVELVDEYEQLRDNYNRAVRKTAVTELLVEDGEVCVTIRTAEGVLKKVPTPYDPANEIYVDFVVVNGRLWIRRVFDENTPPGSGVVINPQLAAIDWDADAAAVGKAAYRRLSDGRWAVSVSGDGSLTLAKVEADTELSLTAPPPIEEFDPSDRAASAEVERIGPGDVIRRIVAP